MLIVFLLAVTVGAVKKVSVQNCTDPLGDPVLLATFDTDVCYGTIPMLGLTNVVFSCNVPMFDSQMRIYVDTCGKNSTNGTLGRNIFTGLCTKSNGTAVPYVSLYCSSPSRSGTRRCRMQRLTSRCCRRAPASFESGSLPTSANAGSV